MKGSCDWAREIYLYVIRPVTLEIRYDSRSPS